MIVRNHIDPLNAVLLFWTGFSGIFLRLRNESLFGWNLTKTDKSLQNCLILPLSLLMILVTIYCNACPFECLTVASTRRMLINTASTVPKISLLHRITIGQIWGLLHLGSPLTNSFVFYNFSRIDLRRLLDQIWLLFVFDALFNPRTTVFDLILICTF